VPTPGKGHHPDVANELDGSSGVPEAYGDRVEIDVYVALEDDVP
jgi:hypothetical protein